MHLASQKNNPKLERHHIPKQELKRVSKLPSNRDRLSVLMVSLVDMLVAPASVESAVGTVEHEVLTEATKYHLPYNLPE